MKIKSVSKACIISKQELLLSGLEEIAFLLTKHTHLKIKTLYKDGQLVRSGNVIAEIEGDAKEILALERTILNILQRLSGIATETHRFIRLLSSRTIHCKKPFIAATRKTPWMSLDKKAVATGGGLTHRLSLLDGILIKDNHISIFRKTHNISSFADSIDYILKVLQPEIKGQLVEIEVENKEEAAETLKAIYHLKSDADFALLLDNFTPLRAQRLLSLLKTKFNLGNIILEASGGINSKNIDTWLRLDLDIISVGALTHSAQAANLSLELA